MARRAENRERGHIGADERQQEDRRAERAAREEVVFGAAAAAPRAEREDADVEDDAQIGEDDERRNHSRSRTRCEGQISRVSTHIAGASSAVYAAW